MTAWIALNSTLRFFLELCALLALMYWGIHTGDSMAEGDRHRCLGTRRGHLRLVEAGRAEVSVVAD